MPQWSAQNLLQFLNNGHRVHMTRMAIQPEIIEFRYDKYVRTKNRKLEIYVEIHPHSPTRGQLYLPIFINDKKLPYCEMNYGDSLLMDRKADCSIQMPVNPQNLTLILNYVQRQLELLS